MVSGAKWMRTAGLALLAGVIGATDPARGELIAYEDFESYRPGQALDRAQDGEGWTRAWSSRAAGTVQERNLHYHRGMVTAGGGERALRLAHDNHSAVVSRSFPPQEDTVYYSFLFMTSTSSGDTGYRHHFALWLNDHATMSVVHDDRDLMGHRFSARAGEFGGEDGGPSTRNDETYFVVAKVSKEAGDTYDRIDLFVNPTTTDEPSTADAVMRRDTEARALSSLGVRLALMPEGHEYFLDDLRIGTTWSAVVPAAYEAAPLTPVDDRLNLETEWRFRPGDDLAWAAPEYDDSGWDTMRVPALWEDEGYPDLEGFAWYRLNVELPDDWAGDPLVIEFGAVSKADETFFNGERVGKTGEFPPRFQDETFNPRRYVVPPHLVLAGHNVIAVRVSDGEIGQRGGIWREGHVLRLADMEERFVISVDSDRPGNLFDATDDKALRVTVQNLSGRAQRLDLAYRIDNYYGETDASGVLPVSLEDNESAAPRIDLAGALERTGMYYARIRLVQDGRTLTEHVATLGVLPPLRDNPPENSPFGVAEQLHRWTDEATLRLKMELLNRAGIRWVRAGFLWQRIEPRPGQFRWAPFDRQIALGEELGIKILPVLAYSASWAAQAPDDEHAAVTRSRFMPDLDDWRHYVRATVERYRDHASYWEIWNEPNGISFWKPWPNARDYARTLQAASEAAREVDPDAQIMVGGLITHLWARDEDRRCYNFMQTIYDELGGGQDFQRIGYHPYPGLQSHHSNRDLVNTMTGVMDEMTAVMARHGDEDKGMWLTEMGTPTSPRRVSPERAAEALVVMSVSMLAYHPVETVFWYQLVNLGTDPHDREQNQGLLNYDLTPKPAYFSYAHLTRQLETARFVTRRALADGQASAYLFEREDAHVMVLWADEGETVVSLPVRGTGARLIDLMGTERDLNIRDGRADVSLTQSPVYLIIPKGDGA